MAIRFTVEEKLTCLRRELIWRKHIYPGRILTGRMTESKAGREIALIEAMIEDYEFLAKAERLL